MSVLTHVNPQLLASHMYDYRGLESAHWYTGLTHTLLVNLAINLSIITNEVHPHPWSLFVMVLPSSPYQSITAESLKQFSLPAEDHEEQKKRFQMKWGQ